MVAIVPSEYNLQANACRPPAVSGTWGTVVEGRPPLETTGVGRL